MNFAFFCFGLAFVAALMQLFPTTSSGGMKSQSQDMLRFGPPLIERVSNGMMALAFLGMAIWTAQDAHEIGDLFMGFWLVPGLVLMSCFCLLRAGPRDVSIDLVHRRCQKERSWIAFPAKRDCALTEMSEIYVYCGGYACYVVLWIGAMKDPKFVLDKANNRAKAVDLAQEIGRLSHLPVRETTLEELRSQVSARKRN